MKNKKKQLPICAILLLLVSCDSFNPFFKKSADSVRLTDTTPPVLDFVKIESTNAASVQQVNRVGDTITLTFEANESLITPPKVTILDQPAEVTAITAANVTRATKWMAQHTVNSLDVFQREAPFEVPFVITYLDLAKNAGKPVSEITVGTQVTIKPPLQDDVAPRLTAISLTSDNAYPSLAKEGDLVTIDFTADELLLSAQASVVKSDGRRDDIITTRKNHQAWQATYQVADGDSQQTDFVITYTDFAGNTSIQSVRSTAQADISIDVLPAQVDLYSLKNGRATFVCQQQQCSGDLTSDITVGTELLLSFSVSERVQLPVVHIEGLRADATVDNQLPASMREPQKTYWRIVNFRVRPSIAVDESLDIVVRVQDLAGNRTTHQKIYPLAIEKQEVPVLRSVSIQNVGDSYRTTGESIIVQFTPSTPFQNEDNPLLHIADETVDAQSASGGQWSATYTVHENSPQGLVQARISYGPAVSRTVVDISNDQVYIDTIAPEIQTISISSDNSYDARMAKLGDTLTLVFAMNEELRKSPTVTFFGQSASNVSSTGSFYVATYTLSDTTLPTEVDFTIDDIEDMAGNQAEAVTRQSVEERVQRDVSIDLQPPQINNISITSSSSKTTDSEVVVVDSGDVITISFTANEPLSRPLVTLLDAKLPAYFSDNTWSASYTLPRIIDQNTRGSLIPYDISYSDKAGNKGKDKGKSGSSNLKIAEEQSADYVTKVDITSDSQYPPYATTGDTVTLSFETSQFIPQPRITLNAKTGDGGALSVSSNFTDDFGNSKKWRAEYVVEQGEQARPVPFTIDYSTSDGNERGQRISESTDGVIGLVSIDAVLPLIEELDIYTLDNNGDKQQQVAAGENVYIAFRANEPLRIAPVVTIASQGAMVTQSTDPVNSAPVARSYVAKAQLSEDATVGKEVAFRISLEDLAGNNSIVDESVDVDYVPLTVKELQQIQLDINIYSTNPNPLWARSGNTIYLDFTSDVALAAPTVTIHGSAATVSQKNNANEEKAWRATYTVTESSKQGEVDFTIDYRAKGSTSTNKREATTATTGRVIVDTSVLITELDVSIDHSSLVILPFTKVRQGDTVTVYFRTPEDEQLQQADVTFQLAGSSQTETADESGDGWKATYTVPSGNGSLSVGITVTDRAGNSATASGTTTVTIDNTLPQITVDISPDSIKYTDRITLSLNADEELATVGITLESFLIPLELLPEDGDLKNWQKIYEIRKGEISQEQTEVDIISLPLNQSDGSITVTYIAYDLAGNYITATEDFSIDSTPPQVQAKDASYDSAGKLVIDFSTDEEATFVSQDITITVTTHDSTKDYTVTPTAETASDGYSNTWQLAYNLDPEPISDFTVDIATFQLRDRVGNVLDVTTDNRFYFDMPEILASRLHSSNAYDTTLATYTDTIYLDFTTDQTMRVVSVTIDDHTTNVTMVDNNMQWQASYQLPMNAPERTEQVDYTIDVTSDSGLAASFSNSGGVTIDTQRPVLQSVAVSRDSAADKIVANNTITVRFQASEPLQNVPLVVFAGIASNSMDKTVDASYDNTDDGTYWRADFSVDSGLRKSRDKLTVVVRFLDLAGNTAEHSEDTDLSIDLPVPDELSMGLQVGGERTIQASGFALTIHSSGTEVAQGVQIARLGDTVTLSASGISAMTRVTMLGKQAVVSRQGKNWQATYTIADSDTSANPMPFTVDYLDTVNVARSTRAITSGQPVKVIVAPSVQVYQKDLVIDDNRAAVTLAIEANGQYRLSYAPVHSNFDDAATTLTLNTQTHTIENLPAYADYQLRVAAIGADGRRTGAYTRASFTTRDTPRSLGATIWLDIDDSLANGRQPTKDKVLAIHNKAEPSARFVADNSQDAPTINRSADEPAYITPSTPYKADTATVLTPTNMESYFIVESDSQNRQTWLAHEDGEVLWTTEEHYALGLSADNIIQARRNNISGPVVLGIIATPKATTISEDGRTRTNALPVQTSEFIPTLFDNAVGSSFWALMHFQPALNLQRRAQLLRYIYRQYKLDMGHWRLRSKSLTDGGSLPIEYHAPDCARDGLNNFPQLDWSSNQPSAQSYAVIVENSESGEIHLAYTNIPPTTIVIEHIANAGVAGSFVHGGQSVAREDGKIWSGACPHGHQAISFRVYALNTVIEGYTHGSQADFEKHYSAQIIDFVNINAFANGTDSAPAVGD